MRVWINALWQRWRKPVISTMIVMVGLRLGDVLSFLNIWMLGRWLPTQEFGQASALLAALAVPATAIGVLVCREAVWLTETQEPATLLRYVWRWFWALLGIGVLIGIIVIVAGPWMRAVFQFKDRSVGYAYACLVVVTIVMPLWGGLLQGQHRFVPLSFVPALQGVVRLAASMGLIYCGFRLTGAIMGPIVSTMAMIVWCAYWAHRPHTSEVRASQTPGQASERRPLFVTLVNDMVPVTAMTMLLSMDIIVVNRLFQNDTGGYSAVSTIGKITFFIPQGLVVTLLPYVMRDKVRGKTSRHYLLATAGVTAMASALIIWILYVWHLELMTLFRPEYGAYAGYLPRYTVAMGLFSVITITVNYAMGRGVRSVGYFLVGLIPVELVVYYLLRHSIKDIIDGVVGIAAVAALGTLALCCVRDGRQSVLCVKEP